MAKKTKKAKKASKAQPPTKAPQEEKPVFLEKVSTEEAPVAEPRAAFQEAPAQEPAPEPAPPVRNGGSLIKTIAVIVLFVALVSLIYYFTIMAENSFMSGPEVDSETFKGIFAGAQNIYIIMDMRGAEGEQTGNNILQCGVDFAASSGMGGKIVTPLSISGSGCVTPDGNLPIKSCMAMLKDGISIYVREGPGGAKYYANGMVVSVGPQYALGTCGIKKN